MTAQGPAREKSEARIAVLNWQIAKLESDEKNYKEVLELIQDQIKQLKLEREKCVWVTK